MTGDTHYHDWLSGAHAFQCACGAWEKEKRDMHKFKIEVRRTYEISSEFPYMAVDFVVGKPITIESEDIYRVDEMVPQPDLSFEIVRDDWDLPDGVVSMRAASS